MYPALGRPTTSMVAHNVTTPWNDVENVLQVISHLQVISRLIPEPTIPDFLQTWSADVQARLRPLWTSIPEPSRQELLTRLKEIPFQVYPKDYPSVALRDTGQQRLRSLLLSVEDMLNHVNVSQVRFDYNAQRQSQLAQGPPSPFSVTPRDAMSSSKDELDTVLQDVIEAFPRYKRNEKNCRQDMSTRVLAFKASDPYKYWNQLTRDSKRDILNALLAIPLAIAKAKKRKKNVKLDELLATASSTLQKVDHSQASSVSRLNSRVVSGPIAAHPQPFLHYQPSSSGHQSVGHQSVVPSPHHSAYHSTAQVQYGALESMPQHFQPNPWSLPPNPFPYPPTSPSGIPFHPTSAERQFFSPPHY